MIAFIRAHRTPSERVSTGYLLVIKGKKRPLDGLYEWVISKRGGCGSLKGLSTPNNAQWDSRIFRSWKSMDWNSL